MSESRRATRPPSAEPWKDPDDAPELGDAWFERADQFVGAQLTQRGFRPSETERLVLPTPLVERFRAAGPGWQIRIEAALQEWSSEHPDRL